MDITGRKRMEEALRAEIAERRQVEAIRRLDEARLEELWQLSRMADSSTYHIAKFALEQLVRLTESKVGWIGFVGEAEASLSVHEWPETDSQGSGAGSGPLHLPVENADIFADAIREKRVVVINDYLCSDPYMCGYLERHGPLARVMIVPIFENDRVVAIAGVGNKSEEYDPSAKEKKIELRSRLDSHIPSAVYLDFMRMKQALINLLVNAVQASKEGGDVTIRCNAKGKNLLMDVIDCGCGIAADKRHEIFSPFYTTKKGRRRFRVAYRQEDYRGPRGPYRNYRQSG